MADKGIFFTLSFADIFFYFFTAKVHFVNCFSDQIAIFFLQFSFLSLFPLVDLENGFLQDLRIALKVNALGLDD